MAKGGLSVIIGMSKAKPKDTNDTTGMGDDVDEGDPYSLAFDALKSDDKAAFAEALRSAVKECMADMHEEEE